MQWPFHHHDPDRIKIWLKQVAVLGLVLLLFFWWRHEPNATWEGTPAPVAPAQTSGGLPSPFEHEGYVITPLAHYSVTAVVLARERYRFDAMAEICPVDLGLGWGPLSEAERINLIDFSQSLRWMDWRVSAKNVPRLKLSKPEVGRHSANTHCVPADSAIREALLRVKRHDLVTLKGYLIKAVRGKNDFTSSTSRTDTGGGACEIVFVTEIESAAL
ncbi:hypothetical protein [Ereboglobus luteus]|uniref:Uncharacterized protein n=1 Tax=Ereboglobus luteus TaxID=1796921 RepID=A0A2U8E2Z2_9BACT|nr:hypothetical protein [Ereboglobus luteus]AWI09248.1 hypothetical protein CKA38_08345 [Ereboglobus luteus]